MKYDDKKKVYYFDNVNLDHNHILTLDAHIVRFIRAYKSRDE